MVRKLTVLQMLPTLEGGGVERGTLEVAQALVAAGHRSVVMSGGGRMVPALTAAGSEHLCWPVGRKSLLTLRLVSRLRRLLAEQQVDILHVRSRVPAWVAWLAWRGMDPAVRPRLVSTVHGLYSVSRYSRIMTRGERVIAVSDTVRDYVLANYAGVDPGAIRVIPRGVSAEEFPYGWCPSPDWLAQWRDSYPQLAGRQVLTLPGRITRLKGHRDFIELIGRLRASGREVHGLVVGGEDPRRLSYARELRDLVRAQGLFRDITFTGYRSDLRDVFSVSDLVLSLSTKPESFGRTVLEALKLGRPVAGYDHGGVGEVLGQIYPAGRVPLGDGDALFETVCGLLECPAPVARSHRFTLQDMLSRTLELYEELAWGVHA